MWAMVNNAKPFRPTYSSALPTLQLYELRIAKNTDIVRPQGGLSP